MKARETAHAVLDTNGENEDFMDPPAVGLETDAYDPLGLLIAMEESVMESFDFDRAISEPPTRAKIGVRAKGYQDEWAGDWHARCNEANCRRRKCFFSRRRSVTIRGANVEYIGKHLLATPHRQR